MSSPVVTVSVLVSIARASPKSATLTRPSSPSSTFSGLTSRWTSPAPWAAARARRTGSSSASARAGETGPCSTTSRRVPPLTYSITRNAVRVAASVPWSCTATTSGLDSRAAERASRAKRSTKSGSSARPGRMTLTATMRSSRVSVDR